MNNEKPSLKEVFTATRNTKVDLVIERAAPKSFRAGRVTQDGKTTVTTSPYDASQGTPEERALLEDHGFDPDRFRIVGPIKSSTWTAYIPKQYREAVENDDGATGVEHKGEEAGDPTGDSLVGATGTADEGGDPGNESPARSNRGALDSKYTFTARAFKFAVVERPADEPAPDELIKAIGECTPLYFHPRLKGMNVNILDQHKPYVVAVGDTQIGKAENPTDELIERLQALMLEASAPAQAMTDLGMKLDHIHLPWLGDCIEGMNSQGGRLRWRTRLTITEQVRVLRRLMLWQIQLFAPLASRLTVVSVPGNHDEANTRDMDTRTDDSWAVDALDQVSDALELAGGYEHVECYVPGPDERAVVLDVGGTLVAHSHGHEHAHNKHFQYWAGQAFGGQPVGQASLWLQGHGHHFHFQEDGSRKWLQVPAVESESVWWKHKTGTGGSPGIVTFQLHNNQISNLSKLEPEEAA